MSSKEKVLAIRPGAVCERKVISKNYYISCWEIKDKSVTIAYSYLSQNLAWTEAYKYLTI